MYIYIKYNKMVKRQLCLLVEDDFINVCKNKGINLSEWVNNILSTELGMLEEGISAQETKVKKLQALNSKLNSELKKTTKERDRLFQQLTKLKERLTKYMEKEDNFNGSGRFVKVS